MGRSPVYREEDSINSSSKENLVMKGFCRPDLSLVPNTGLGRPRRNLIFATSASKPPIPPVGLLPESLKDGKRPLGAELNGIKTDQTAILSVGDDVELLKTRHLVLESADYRVYSIPGNGSVEDEAVLRIDLVIICHSVRQCRAAAIVSSLRNVNPHLPILQLSTLYDGRPDACDDVLSSADGPRSLLAKVRHMLTKSRNAPVFESHT